MSSLRDDLQLAFPEERIDVPPAVDAWQRGRVQRRRRRWAAGTGGLVAALVMGVAGLQLVADPAARTPSVTDRPDGVVLDLPSDGGPQYQDEVLADGHVSFEEYELAQLYAVRCIEASGFTVEYPAGYWAGGFGVDPTLSPTYAGVVDEDDDGWDAAWREVSERCARQWHRRIDEVWMRQLQPTPEELDAILERAWACARDHGMELSDPPTQSEARQAHLEYGCPVS